MEWKSYDWLLQEIGDRVEENWELPEWFSLLNREADEGVENSELDKQNTLATHLEWFVLTKSKRIMNDFLLVVDGFW